MPRVKVAPSRQVVIPKKFWDVLHLKPGDLFDVEIDPKNHALIFSLKDVVDRTEGNRKKWIKELIKSAREHLVELSEEEIVTDRGIKKQLFKEKYGTIKE